MASGRWDWILAGAGDYCFRLKRGLGIGQLAVEQTRSSCLPYVWTSAFAGMRVGPRDAAFWDTENITFGYINLKALHTRIRNNTTGEPAQNANRGASAAVSAAWVHSSTMTVGKRTCSTHNYHIPGSKYSNNRTFRPKCSFFRCFGPHYIRAKHLDS